MSTTIIRDNKSIHENNQFHIIEGLYDSIFERMDKAIDMKKGLLTDVEDVFLVWIRNLNTRSWILVTMIVLDSDFDLRFLDYAFVAS